MTAKEYARTTARVARLSAIGVVAGSLAWVQGIAWGAGLGVATLVAVNVVPAWIAPPPTAAPAPPPEAPPLSPRGASAPTPSEDSLPPNVPPPPRREPVVQQAPALSPPPPEARGATIAEPAESPPASESDSLAEEAALLQRAQGALASNPAEALALAETHATRFPRGKLRMEREFVIVDALRRQGRSAEARALGEAMLARAQGSLYEDRIRKLLDQTR